MIFKRYFFVIILWILSPIHASTDVYFSNETDFHIKIISTRESAKQQSPFTFAPHTQKKRIASLDRKFKWGSALGYSATSTSFYVLIQVEDEWLAVGKIEQVVRFHKVAGSDLGFSISAAKKPFKIDDISPAYLANEFKESHYSEKNFVADTTQLATHDNKKIILELYGAKKSGTFLSNDDLYYALLEK